MSVNPHHGARCSLVPSHGNGRGAEDGREGLLASISISRRQF